MEYIKTSIEILLSLKGEERGGKGASNNKILPSGLLDNSNISELDVRLTT
jgi:hypothetical protein